MADSEKMDKKLEKMTTKKDKLKDKILNTKSMFKLKYYQARLGILKHSINKNIEKQQVTELKETYETMYEEEMEILTTNLKADFSDINGQIAEKIGRQNEIAFKLAELVDTPEEEAYIEEIDPELAKVIKKFDKKRHKKREEAEVEDQEEENAGEAIEDIEEITALQNESNELENDIEGLEAKKQQLMAEYEEKMEVRMLAKKQQLSEAKHQVVEAKPNIFQKIGKGVMGIGQTIAKTWNSVKDRVGTFIEERKAKNETKLLNAKNELVEKADEIDTDKGELLHVVVSDMVAQKIRDVEDKMAGKNKATEPEEKEVAEHEGEEAEAPEVSDDDGR